MTRLLPAARWWLVLTALAAGVAACDNGDGTGTANPPPATTPSTGAESEVAGLDFVAGSEVDLGDGWRLSPCEAGPSLFCARLAGETQATIELLDYPTATYPTVQNVLDAGGSPIEALRAQALEFHDTFVKDRPLGCGATYLVEPFGPETARVAGSEGVLYGFDGKQDGRHVERGLQFAAIQGPTLYVVATTAVDDGTCMDDGELFEFTVAELTRLQPKLVQAVAAGRLR